MAVEKYKFWRPQGCKYGRTLPALQGWIWVKRMWAAPPPEQEPHTVESGSQLRKSRGNQIHGITKSYKIKNISQYAAQQIKSKAAVLGATWEQPAYS